MEPLHLLLGTGKELWGPGSVSGPVDQGWCVGPRVLSKHPPKPPLPCLELSARPRARTPLRLEKPQLVPCPDLSPGQALADHQSYGALPASLPGPSCRPTRHLNPGPDPWLWRPPFGGPSQPLTARATWGRGGPGLSLHKAGTGKGPTAEGGSCGSRPTRETNMLAEPGDAGVCSHTSAARLLEEQSTCAGAKAREPLEGCSQTSSPHPGSVFLSSGVPWLLHQPRWGGSCPLGPWGADSSPGWAPAPEDEVGGADNTRLSSRLQSRSTPPGHAHACSHTHLHSHTFVSVHSHSCLHTHTCSHTLIFTHTHTYLPMQTHTHTHMLVCMHVHHTIRTIITHTFTPSRALTHTQTPAVAPGPMAPSLRVAAPRSPCLRFQPSTGPAYTQ